MNTQDIQSQTFTYDQVFAAMCLHETLDASDGHYPAYEKQRETDGICVLRDVAIEMAASCDALWNHMHNLGDFDGAFDAEFVPLFLERFTNAKDPHADKLICHTEAVQALTGENSDETEVGEDIEHEYAFDACQYFTWHDVPGLDADDLADRNDVREHFADLIKSGFIDFEHAVTNDENGDEV